MADVSDASKKREQELRKIVLSWLNKKGYTKAGEAFQKEAQVDGSEPLTQFAFRRGLEADFCVKNYILQWGMEDMQPSRYEESYVELRDWSMKLLDDLKCEISELLYPIFVHCFLELVSKQYVTEAKMLLTRQRHNHEPEYSDEIEAFNSLSDATQLEGHIVARRYLRNTKYKVLLCHESDRTLTEFLHNKRLSVLVRIINQHLDVVVYGATVHDLPPSIKVPTEGADGKQHKRIRFGLLEEEQVAERNAKRKSEGGLEGASAEAGGEGGGVPMPVVSEEHEVKVLEDMKKRVRLSGSSLPSVCFYTFFNAKDTLSCVDLAADASTLAGGFTDSRVKMWDLTKVAGDRGASLSVDAAATQGVAGGVSLVGHAGAVYAVSLSPDNRFTLSSSGDSTVRLWDVASQENVVTYRGHNFPVWDCCFSPLGHYFATASHDRTARLWSTEHVFPLRLMPGHLSDVDCVTFHPNCNYLASGSSDRTCRMWDITGGDCVRLFKGHSAPVTSVAVSWCGTMLASGADDGEIIVWDIGSSKSIHSFKGQTGAIYSLDFSRGDSRLLASGGHDGVVRLFEVGAGASGKQTMLPTRQAIVHKVKFSRTNLLLAAGAYQSDK